LNLLDSLMHLMTDLLASVQMGQVICKVSKIDWFVHLSIMWIRSDKVCWVTWSRLVISNLDELVINDTTTCMPNIQWFIFVSSKIGASITREWQKLCILNRSHYRLWCNGRNCLHK
jgi:hypothetical protein